MILTTLLGVVLFIVFLNGADPWVPTDIVDLLTYAVFGIAAAVMFTFSWSGVAATLQPDAQTYPLRSFETVYDGGPMFCFEYVDSMLQYDCVSSDDAEVRFGAPATVQVTEKSYGSWLWMPRVTVQSEYEFVLEQEPR